MTWKCIPTESPTYITSMTDWYDDEGAIAESDMANIFESEQTIFYHVDYAMKPEQVSDMYLDMNIKPEVTSDELKKLSNSIKTRLIILLEMRGL